MYPDDKQFLLNGEWITDSIINAGQSLLEKDYPHVGGLQPTFLARKFQFSVQRSEFVQILNVYGSHWLTISNIGCPTGTINVYDSLPNCYLSSDTKRQIAAILFLSDQRKITVNFVDVQIQSNGSDCGLYALAFTTSLCCGDNPSKINYRSHKLREHLFNCLENHVMTSFPRRNRQKKALIRKEKSFQIFCECRQTEYGPMINCCTCHEWYHKECITAPAAAWKIKSTKWLCNKCSMTMSS